MITLGPFVIKKSDTEWEWARFILDKSNPDDAQTYELQTMEYATPEEFEQGKWRTMTDESLLNQTQTLSIYDPDKDRKEYCLVFKEKQAYRFYFRKVGDTWLPMKGDEFNAGRWLGNRINPPLFSIGTDHYWKPDESTRDQCDQQFKAWALSSELPWYAKQKEPNFSVLYEHSGKSKAPIETPLNKQQQLTIQLLIAQDITRLKAESVNDVDYRTALRLAITGDLSSFQIETLSTATQSNVYVVRDWVLPTTINQLTGFYKDLTENNPAYHVTIADVVNYIKQVLLNELKTYEPESSVTYPALPASIQVRVSELQAPDMQLLHQVQHAMSNVGQEQMRVLYHALTLGIQGLDTDAFHQLLHLVKQIQRRSAQGETQEIMRDIHAIYLEDHGDLEQAFDNVLMLLQVRHLIETIPSLAHKITQPCYEHCSPQSHQEDYQHNPDPLSTEEEVLILAETNTFQDFFALSGMFDEPSTLESLWKRLATGEPSNQLKRLIKDSHVFHSFTDVEIDALPASVLSKELEKISTIEDVKRAEDTLRFYYFKTSITAMRTAHNPLPGILMLSLLKHPKDLSIMLLCLSPEEKTTCLNAVVATHRWAYFVKNTAALGEVLRAIKDIVHQQSIAVLQAISATLVSDPNGLEALVGLGHSDKLAIVNAWASSKPIPPQVDFYWLIKMLAQNDRLLSATEEELNNYLRSDALRPELLNQWQEELSIFSNTEHIEILTRNTRAIPILLFLFQPIDTEVVAPFLQELAENATLRQALYDAMTTYCAQQNYSKSYKMLFQTYRKAWLQTLSVQCSPVDLGQQLHALPEDEISAYLDAIPKEKMMSMISHWSPKELILFYRPIGSPSTVTIVSDYMHNSLIAMAQNHASNGLSVYNYGLLLRTFERISVENIVTNASDALREWIKTPLQLSDLLGREPPSERRSNQQRTIMELLNPGIFEQCLRNMSDLIQFLEPRVASDGTHLAPPIPMALQGILNKLPKKIIANIISSKQDAETLLTFLHNNKGDYGLVEYLHCLPNKILQALTQQIGLSFGEREALPFKALQDSLLAVCDPKDKELIETAYSLPHLQRQLLDLYINDKASEAQRICTCLDTPPNTSDHYKSKLQQFNTQEDTTGPKP